MEDYQFIWENHFGPIPFDDFGRKFHIHHIDGNRLNNSIQNLKCLSVQDHYNIHYEQKDYYACFLLARRFLKYNEEELNNLRKLVGENLKDTITVKDNNGKYYRVSKDDTAYLTGDLVGVTKGFVSGKIIATGKSIHLSQEKFEELKEAGIVKGVTAGIPLSPEHKHKVSEAISGLRRTVEHKKNYRQGTVGRRRIENVVTGKRSWAYPIKNHPHQLTFDDIKLSKEWIYN